MQSSMHTRSCYSEQSQKQTSGSNTFSQWNSRHCASQWILFIFFRKHTLLPGQHCWLTPHPCCAAGVCFLCALHWVSRAKYLLFHQFPNTAFLPTTFKTAGSSWMCQICCAIFSIIFSFPQRDWMVSYKPSVVFCISILRNNSYRRARTREKVGLNSDNCPNNFVVGCIVI